MNEKAHKEKLQQLQMLEHNIQTVLSQKQQFQTQLFEIENALKELETSTQSYKILGGLMVSAKNEDLKKELKQKKELVELRISSFEKQESQLKDKTKALQEEVLASMKQ